MRRLVTSVLCLAAWTAACGGAPAPSTGMHASTSTSAGASTSASGPGPDDGDRDGDRIGATDRCPDTPETYNGNADDDGCPDQALPGQCVWVDTMRIAEQLPFAPGASTLGRDQDPILEALAATLVGNPQVERVAVVGGAGPDESGAEVLAMARARAVLSELLSRGVEASRLEAHAYGGRPARGDETARARSVWFVLLQVDGRPVHDARYETELAPYRLDCDAERARARETGQLINCDCAETTR